MTSKGSSCRRYNPYVLAEHGVVMLSGILRSEMAIATSIQIIETFVEIRKYISNNLIEQKHINELVIKYFKRIA